MWPRVLEPGPLEKKKEGKTPKTGWSVDLLLPSNDPDTRNLISTIDAFFKSRHGDSARYGQNGRPYKPFLDEHEEPTGMHVFKFKANQFAQTVDPVTGEVTLKELSSPRVEDASGQPWKRDLLIGNGSIGRVAFTVYSWTSQEGGRGVSLGLRAVRVLMHVPYQGNSLEGVFGDPEVGFTADPSPFDPKEEEAPF